MVKANYARSGRGCCPGRENFISHHDLASNALKQECQEVRYNDWQVVKSKFLSLVEAASLYHSQQVVASKSVHMNQYNCFLALFARLDSRPR